MNKTEEAFHNYVSTNPNYNYPKWEFKIADHSLLYSWGGIVRLNNPVDRKTGEVVEVIGYKPLLIDAMLGTVDPIFEWPWVDLLEIADSYAKEKGYSLL